MTEDPLREFLEPLSQEDREKAMLDIILYGTAISRTGEDEVTVLEDLRKTEWIVLLENDPRF